MKIFFFTLGLLLTATFASASLCAQSPMPAPPFGPTHIGGEERPDAPVQEDFRRLAAQRLWRGFGPVAEKPVLTKGLLAPSPQDRADNETFLRQKDTGLIKLLTRTIDPHADRKTKSVKIPGGGAYYSFFSLAHDYTFGSDLEFDQKTLSVSSAGPIYGMLTDLGDVSLADLSSDDARAAFMATYRPARKGTDVRCETQRFRDGVTMDGSLYNLSLPVKVNSTYLLRSINYYRSDVLVGFRVTRQESDGSITILWKLLKQYGRPTLERVVYVNPVDKCPPR
jgi:hypothetical protein